MSIYYTPEFESCLKQSKLKLPNLLVFFVQNGILMCMCMCVWGFLAATICKNWDLSSKFKLCLCVRVKCWR